MADKGVLKDAVNIATNEVLNFKKGNTYGWYSKFN